MKEFLLAMSLAFVVLAAHPAVAANEIIITAASVAAGNITPGDSPGYPADITQPGSYILGSDLTPGANEDGISIHVSNVTIDLGGHTISGNGRYGVAPPIPILDAQLKVDFVTVKNGNIVGMETGVSCAAFKGWVIDRLNISEFSGEAVTLGQFSSLTNSTLVNRNSVDIEGVSGREYSRLENNTIVSRFPLGGIGQTSIILGNSIISKSGTAINIPNKSFVGYGNNTIIGQVRGPARPLTPNRCSPACP